MFLLSASQISPLLCYPLREGERMEGNGQRDGERGCAMQSNWYVNPSLGWTAAQWLNAASDFIAAMQVFLLTDIDLFRQLQYKFFTQRFNCSDWAAEKPSSIVLQQDSPCYFNMTLNHFLCQWGNWMSDSSVNGADGQTGYSPHYFLYFMSIWIISLHVMQFPCARALLHELIGSWKMASGPCMRHISGFPYWANSSKPPSRWNEINCNWIPG